MTGPDPQALASDPEATIFVSANAGSGKTSTLVSRVARLLLAGTDPGAILCVTYTRAAAAEMQSRLFRQLGEWAVTPDEDLRRRLAAQGADPAADLTRARALFARALETPGGLKIQTIHGFCERLLRRFPLEAGVTPGFVVVEEAAAAALRRAARDRLAELALKGPAELRTAFERLSVSCDPSAFDALMEAADLYRETLESQPLRAGWDYFGLAPGTTAEAIMAQAEKAIDRDAWRDAAERAKGRNGPLGEAIGAAMQDFSWPRVRPIFFTQKDGPRKPGRLAKELRPWFESQLPMAVALADRLMARDSAERTEDFLRVAKAYGRLLRIEKAHRGVLDFADLAERALRLIEDGGDAQWVLYKLDGGLSHVLVDEAQDTAPEQWRVIGQLTAEFFAGAGARPDPHPRRTVFLVGDEKQSIYSFQGARPERLAHEARTYIEAAGNAGQTARRIALEKSFRSTEKVLSFVDAVFATGDRWKSLNPAAQAPPHHFGARTEPGCVDLWALHESDPTEPYDAWAPPDAITGRSGVKLLAEAVAAEIEAIVARGDRVSDRDHPEGRPAGFGDVLVLVRRRGVEFEAILRSLKARAIPVAGADRLKLAEHIIFEDLRSVARHVLFPADDLTTAELLRSPLCDMDEDDLYALCRGREGRLDMSLSERAGQDEKARAAADLIGAARRLFADHPPFDAYVRLLDRVDGAGLSPRRRFARRLGREAEEAIEAFLALLLKLEGQGARDLEGLAAALDTVSIEIKREMDAPRGEVRLMTVHGAKGLEAPVVFLPDTVSLPDAKRAPIFETPAGIVLGPFRKPDDCEKTDRLRQERQARDHQEYMRLLYVAMTRARDRLVICGVKPKRDLRPECWYRAATAAFDGPLKADARHFEAPHPFRRIGADPAPVAMRPVEGEAIVTLPEWISKPAPALVRRRITPSQGMASAEKAIPPLDATDRFLRGTLIHVLLEILPERPADRRRQDALAWLSRQPGLRPDQETDVLETAMKVLEDPTFAALFGPGSRAEAALVGVSSALPGLDVTGKVDRLVVTEDEILVVDFKSNRTVPVRIEDADPAYIGQLAVYVALLRDIWPDRHVRAGLLWTEIPRLDFAPAAMIDDALALLRDGTRDVDVGPQGPYLGG